MPIAAVPYVGRFRLLLVCVLLLGCGGCASTARWQEAYTLVTELARPAQASSAEADAARRVERRYEIEGRRYLADVYEPRAGARADLVLVHGLTDLGKDDPRLRRLAAALAQARFRVLVPQLESLTRFSVGTRNIGAIRDAVRYLGGLPDRRERPLGVAAISYSAGPAILAAATTDVRDEVDFVFSVGAYYELAEAIGFATTGYYRVDGKWRYREPDADGRWLLLRGNAGQLSDPADRELLLQIARRKLDDPRADVDDLAARLSAAGADAYALVANPDPARVPALIERLPPMMRRELAALDLSDRDLSGLKARLILLHGRDDPMIPFTHSKALAAAVPPGRADLFIVGGLVHVDIEPGWRDALALWRAALALLEARDGER